MQVKRIEGEHSSILLTFTKLKFAIKIFVLSVLSGRFTQVLLYLNIHCIINIYIGMTYEEIFHRKNSSK